MTDGDRIKFDTHGGDSKLNHLSGQTGTIERPYRQATPLLPDSEADSIGVVGRMFWVNLDNGERIGAFEDELEPIL